MSAARPSESVAAERASSPLFVAGACLVAMSLIGGVSLLVEQPLIFPALGASTLVVFADPHAVVAQPRNVVLGHSIGAVLGWAALWLCFGHPQAGSLIALSDWRFVLSGSLALAATGFALTFLRVKHPPSAATTMIVGLGLLPKLEHLVAIVAAALLHVVLGWTLHRQQGVRYPLPSSPTRG
jgi:CBS-domain-containing membrane protein